jgi:hypothetical protein
MLTWLADALRAEGCKVIEESGWKNRGRSGSFAPYGVLWHHTAATASTSNPFPSKNVLINGRSDLPGPLCQVGIDYNGGCHIIAAGRANHAGACNGFGPFSSSQDGNAQLVGLEIDYNGTQPMSAAQKDAATRASAAILKKFKRDYNYAARHAETSTTGKWDTGGVTGDQLRKMIKDYMAGGGSGGDDMPSYVHVRKTKASAVKKGTWTYIEWDDIIQGGSVAKAGSPSISVQNHAYSASLHAQFECPASSDTIRTRIYEVDKNNEVAELNEQVEHQVTSGSTMVQDTRSGWCNDGRVLRFRVYTPQDATLTSADLVLMYW